MEGYFRSMTDSLSGMWSNMIAQMIIEQKALAGMSMAASAGTMAVAGVALYAAQSYFSRKDKKKAKEKERNDLNNELDDSIAKLKMSDISYEIYKTTDALEKMAYKVRRTGADIEKLNEYRQLEIDRLNEEMQAYYDEQRAAAIEPYDNVLDKYSGWTDSREQSGWGVADWTEQVATLNAQFSSMSSSDEEYFSVAEDTLDAIMTLVDVSEAQLDSYKNAKQSIDSQIWDLNNNNDSLPIAIDDYDNRYAELLAATSPADDGTVNLDSIAAFQAFTNDYINIKNAYGFDVNETIKQVTGDLASMSGSLEVPMSSLEKAIIDNTGAIGGEDGNTSALNNLITMMQYDRREAVHKAWYNDEDDDGKSDNIGIAPAMSVGGIDGNSWGNSEAGYDPVNAPGGDHRTSREVELEKLTADWNIYGSTLRTWLNNADTENMTSDQLSIRQNWLTDLDNMPEVYDGLAGAGTGAEQVALGQAWAQFFQDILGNGDLEELAMFNVPIPAFAKGGWTDQPSIFGEKGPEWAIPAHNNPNNQNFLQSVGMDKILEAIQNMQSVQTAPNGDITINLTVDGRELSYVIIDQARKNPELARCFRNA